MTLVPIVRAIKTITKYIVNLEVYLEQLIDQVQHAPFLRVFNSCTAVNGNEISFFQNVLNICCFLIDITGHIIFNKTHAIQSINMYIITRQKSCVISHSCFNQCQLRFHSALKYGTAHRSDILFSNVPISLNSKFCNDKNIYTDYIIHRKVIKFEYNSKDIHYN